MEGTIGEVKLFAGNFAPNNWAFCQGQTIQIPENEALFSILGIQFGGDGRQTFMLPKLDNIKCGQGELRYIICQMGFYPSRH